jgi:hypothetical protein
MSVRGNSGSLPSEFLARNASTYRRSTSGKRVGGMTV